MKAAVLETIDAPLVIGDVEIGALSHGQVLVKMRVSGICGSQLQEIAGNKGNAKFVPHLLGHEGCGIVEDTGPGVTKVRKGDRVILHWRKGDGLESDFPSYTYKGKTMQSGKVTTFSEYSIVSENRVTPVPDDAPDDLCALLGCGLSTALGVIEVKWGCVRYFTHVRGMIFKIPSADPALSSCFPYHTPRSSNWSMQWSRTVLLS